MSRPMHEKLIDSPNHKKMIFRSQVFSKYKMLKHEIKNMDTKYFFFFEYLNEILNKYFVFQIHTRITFIPSTTHVWLQDV